MHTALTTDPPNPPPRPSSTSRSSTSSSAAPSSTSAALDIAPLVVIGDRLGLYRALATDGPLTSAELAARTGTAERYVREWLNAQAASGYVTYHAESGRYSLTPEQALAFADEDGPAFIVGAFQTAIAAGRIVDQLTEAFRTGEGIGWHEHDHALFHGIERFFRSSYLGNLVQAWIPALDGMEAKLRAGARVADIGCGHGASTIIMAQAYPAVAVRRLRLSPGLDRRRQRARPQGRRRGPLPVRGRRSAKDFPGTELRPRHGVRRAARHGRSGRRGAPRPVDARARAAAG